MVSLVSSDFTGRLIHSTLLLDIYSQLSLINTQQYLKYSMLEGNLYSCLWLIFCCTWEIIYCCVLFWIAKNNFILHNCMCAPKTSIITFLKSIEFIGETNKYVWVWINIFSVQYHVSINLADLQASLCQAQ